MIGKLGAYPATVDRQSSAQPLSTDLPRTSYGGRPPSRVASATRFRGRRILADMDLAQRISEDLGGLWRQVGNLTRAVTVFDVRFDRVDGDIATLKADVAMLKTDVSVLKADVAELKTDVAATKEQLNRLERATENRFNRVDAQLDRLVALIQRDEVKN